MLWRTRQNKKYNNRHTFPASGRDRIDRSECIPLQLTNPRVEKFCRRDDRKRRFFAPRRTAATPRVRRKTSSDVLVLNVRLQRIASHSEEVLELVRSFEIVQFLYRPFALFNRLFEKKNKF